MIEYEVKVRYPGDRFNWDDKPEWLRFKEGEEAQMEQAMRGFLARYYGDAPIWSPFPGNAKASYLIGFFVREKSGFTFNPFSVTRIVNGVRP